MLSDLAFALAAAGETVTVITSRQLYDAPETVLADRETVKGVEIRRAWTTRFGRKRLAGRAIDYLTFYVSAAWQLFRSTRRGDIVIAKTDPPMFSVVAAPIAQLKGAILVNWLQDIFPEVAEALGVGRSKLARFSHRAMRSLRNYSLRRAEVNVVLGERMAEHVEAQGIERARIRIIANWADGVQLKPVAPKDNPLRQAWGLSGKFVAGYSGNLGRAHEYATLLDAMAVLASDTRRQCPASPDAGRGGETATGQEQEIVWLIIGGGALFETLKEEVARRGFSSVRFEPRSEERRVGKECA